MNKRDNLLADLQENLKDWSFNENVAEVFPDMAKRSIPGYLNIIQMIGLFAKRFVQKNSNIYDLGCSLGAVTQSIQQNIHENSCQIFAIDNSNAMISRCKRILQSYKSKIPIHFIEDNIQNISIENASFVVLNFTLQFIPPNERKNILQTIFNGMNQNGMLILSEKIHFSDPKIDELLNETYLNFKRANGYSELEISQKRNSLENVMKIDSIETHLSRLKNAGFSHVTIWHQCLNFVSFLAVK